MPKYEVKNIKDFIGMEGHGFNASLYCDGKRIGMVSDHATGASYVYDMSNKDYETLDEYTKSIFVPEEHMINGMQLDYYGPDSFIAKLVQEYENAKFYRTKCRNSILFITDDCKKDEYFTIKAKYTVETALRLREKYNIIEIINERYL